MGRRTSDAKRPIRPGLLLAVLATTQLTLQLDTTIVTVALPSVQAALGISDADRHWVVTAYAITFGGLLLLGGRVGDYLARKRALVWSLVGFGIASLLGGLAGTAGLLYAARALQGASGAVLAPVVLSLITTSFTEPGHRAKAFAVWGGVGGLGASLGLLLGGVLTEYTSWRWTLLVNAPLAVAIAVAALLVVRESKATVRGRLDLPGTVTSTLGVAAIVYGATLAESYGWASVQALGPMVGGLVLLAAFVGIEHRATDPLLPLSVLADRVRGSSFGATALLAGAIFASNVLIIYYLQQVRGYNAFESGLAFLPNTLAVLAFATVGGRLVLRVGPRVVIAAGAASGVAGFLLLASADGATPLAVLVAAMALVGAAVGLSWPALSATALTGVPDEHAGAAGGTVNAAQQVSGAVVVAVLNTVAAGVTAGSGSLMDGLSVALLVCAGLMVATVLVSLNITVPRERTQS
ncbi:drug resistance transporter, EmrB/QacA subfamily [Promicromonospora thailandica]|uniref:Drug resistance transporter, EmrB/QacA subfamily n=2 Tax=Promicromonospora thailandica TaxID=765201 RepID=A0A9X2G4E7_9MICO|nr:drug resistance transporter, EmrB/QacA subfamily [Promicromonospora thailandica]